MCLKNLFLKINEWKEWFEERGISIKVINVGGGLGVNYHHLDEQPIASLEEYFSIFDQFLERPPQQEVHFELGRSLIAPCGNLISKVLFVKKGSITNFLVIDAGMTDLMRPALYQAYHKIELLESKTDEAQPYDIVGPICESSDTFGTAFYLASPKRGDLLIIRTAGAYGEVMASSYNLRNPIQSYFSHQLNFNKI